MKPRIVDLVAGAFRAEVYTHTLARDGAAVPVTTWRSRGLRAFGNPEVSVTLLRDPQSDAEALSLDAMRFMTTLYDQSKRGVALTAGTYGEFPQGLFDGGEPYGLVLVRGQRVGALRAHGLDAVVLHRDELALARAYGFRRVLSRLARAERYAPYPPWWNPMRPSVVHVADEQTLLAPLTRISAARAAAVWHGDEVSLRLAPRDREGFRAALEHIGTGDAFAILVDAEHDADATLVWAPGQTTAAAAAKPDARGERVSAAFVGVVSGAPRDRCALAEDGFVFELGDDSYDALRGALCAGHDVAIASETRALRVTWADPAPLPGENPAAVYDRVEVLAGFGARPAAPPEVLAEYVQRIRDAVLDALDGTTHDKGQDLCLHVELHPSRAPSVTLGVRPGPVHRAMQGLCGLAESIEAPRVEAPAVMRVMFKLWGGAEG